jgi:hypothetical protein
MLGTITVVNKYNHTDCSYDQYIGRPSVLGNPYIITRNGSGHGTRVEVIGMYDKWLNKMLQEYEPIITREFRLLLDRYLVGETIHLVCFCVPKECHGHVIKRVLEDTVKLMKVYQ